MRRKVRTILLWMILGSLGLCLVLAGVSAAYNSRLPWRSSQTNLLSPIDMARIAEAEHLRQSLGGTIWPGWEKAAIPILLYNEEYAFVVGKDQPSDGWQMPVNGEKRGGAWEAVPDGNGQGQAYFRQPVTGANNAIGAFIVRVDGRWTACFQTREWEKISFYRYGWRESLPPLIRDIFPYPLAGQFILGQSDQYLVSLLHESFHAFQASAAGGRLAAAETTAHLESTYPWDDPVSEKGWQAEIEALSGALRAKTHPETVEYTRRFLLARAARRANTRLSPTLIDYERQREWLEGLAKYAELTIGRAAALSPDYRALPEMASDQEFRDGYHPQARFYELQMDEISRAGNQKSETRFYYTGAAEAVLLDRLNPAWKAQAFQDGVWLENLLAEAVK